jgi:hypothetical protein
VLKRVRLETTAIPGANAMKPAFFDKLQEITNSFDMSPYSINDGCCYEWAEDVLAALPRVEIWEVPAGFGDAFHAFVRIDGVFYDAECLTGVADYSELPIFAKLDSQQPVWLIDHNRTDKVQENSFNMTDDMRKEYYN